MNRQNRAKSLKMVGPFASHFERLCTVFGRFIDTTLNLTVPITLQFREHWSQRPGKGRMAACPFVLFSVIVCENSECTWECPQIVPKNRNRLKWLANSQK